MAKLSWVNAGRIYFGDGLGALCGETPACRVTNHLAGPNMMRPWMATAALARFVADLLGRPISALVAATIPLSAPCAVAQPAVPDGVWLIDGRVAVQIYDCASLMCGRILWLKVPRNAIGQLDRDKHNPHPALRERELCGLTMIWNLHPDGLNRWKDGWFYNPDDGGTYRVSAQLKSDDVILARIYLGVPLFGRTKTLARVPHGVSEGWC
jgi:uncharacterized protein (DUF2147 family)